MENKNREITIHSSAAEYLTYVASTVVTQIVSRCAMRTRTFG